MGQVVEKGGLAIGRYKNWQNPCFFFLEIGGCAVFWKLCSSGSWACLLSWVACVSGFSLWREGVFG